MATDPFGAENFVSEIARLVAENTSLRTERAALLTSIPQTWHRSNGFQMGFVAGPDELRKLDGLLAQLGDERQYTVYLADKSRTTFQRLEDVLELPNSEKRRIVCLVIASRFRNQEVWVRLEDWQRGDNVTYAISGTIEQITTVGRNLEEWLLGVRAWHTRFKLDGWGKGPWHVILVAWCLAASSFRLQDHFRHGWSFVAATLFSFAVVLPGVGVIFLLANRRFMPGAAFRIGQGEARHGRLHAGWNFLVQVVGVGLLVSVAASWIWSKIAS